MKFPKKSFAAALLLVCAATAVTPMQAEAASARKKQQAMYAYRTFMNQSQIPWTSWSFAPASQVEFATADINKDGIKELIWKEGKQYCPAFTGNWAVCNMVPHRYTTDKGKSCPGNYLFGKYGEIAERVNARLKGEDEDMDINKLLAEMTDEQAYEIVRKAEMHAHTLPDDEWSEKEGWFEKAHELGISDGSDPVRHMKRNEVMAVLGRLGLLK